MTSSTSTYASTDATTNRLTLPFEHFAAYYCYHQGQASLRQIAAAMRRDVTDVRDMLMSATAHMLDRQVADPALWERRPGADRTRKPRPAAEKVEAREDAAPATPPSTAERVFAYLYLQTGATLDAVSAAMGFNHRADAVAMASVVLRKSAERDVLVAAAG